MTLLTGQWLAGHLWLLALQLDHIGLTRTCLRLLQMHQHQVQRDHALIQKDDITHCAVFYLAIFIAGSDEYVLILTQILGRYCNGILPRGFVFTHLGWCFIWHFATAVQVH